MTTIAIPNTFSGDAALSGADLDANFTTIKDFLNCAGSAGIDATNIASSVRLANNQLAEPNALVFTPTLIVVQQAGVPLTFRENAAEFAAPCDLVLVDVAINVSKTDSASASATVRIYGLYEAPGIVDVIFSDSSINNAWRLASFEIKEGSVVTMYASSMSANVEFLTARAIFKAAHTGR